jgi:hypothetical protein
MPPPTRKTRPDLDRHGPVRGFDGVFGRRPDAARPDAVHANGAGPASANTVAQGVEAGYRVIEDYIRQGQAFARSAVAPRSSATSPASDPQRLTERMVQYASDLAAVWLEYTRITMGQPRAAAPSATIADTGRTPDVGAFDLGNEPARARAPASGANGRGGTETDHAPRLETPRISIDIRSKLRAEISVELKPGSARRPLEAHDLRHRDPGIERISPVVLEVAPEDNRISIRLAIHEQQPGGTYTGLIVDAESNLPQGSLSVRLFEEASGS